MRHSTSFGSEVEPATAMSHSSLAQMSVRHQSPEVRQGPEAQIIFPRTRQDELILCVLMRPGRPFLICTSARHGGRKTLKPITHRRLPIADCRWEFIFFLPVATL